MTCPRCGSENITVYCGRNEGKTYKRYRRCLNCYVTFTTRETAVDNARIKDQRREA